MQTILKLTPLLERILIAVMAIGVLLGYINIDGTLPLQIGFIGLAVIYFLNTYKIYDFKNPEEGPGNFKELLVFVITPKVISISCAVSILGIFFYWRSLGYAGYKQLMLIGGTCIAFGLLIIGYGVITGIPKLKLLSPLLLRAAVMLALDAVILFRAASF